MKIIVPVIVFLFFIINSSQAQEFNGGLYGGVLMSQLHGDQEGGYDKFGFLGGGYVNRFIKKDLLAFQMGLRYIQKGSRAKDNTYKCVLHYVEMPITAKYYPKKKLKLNVEAGLTVGYLIKSTEYINGVEEIDPPPFNKMELGFIGGVNYEVSDKISIGAHFLYSILYVRPHSQDYNSMKEGQHNNLLTFSVAYKLSNWR